MRRQKFGRNREDFYFEKQMSVYANLIKLVMKTAFTKQLGPEIFRPIVASFCVTSESIKLIVIKLLIFLCNMEW